MPLNAATRIELPPSALQRTGERLTSFLTPLHLRRYFDTDYEEAAKRCFNCGGAGHMSRDCPNAERQRPCFLCAQYGHDRANCPNRVPGALLHQHSLSALGSVRARAWLLMG